MPGASAHGQVVLFGGEGASFAILNDTWVWDGANWIQKSPQISPSARSGHAMAYDTHHDQTVLFGGTDVNDTWVWDGSNWTQQFPQTSPPARSGDAMAYDSAHDQTVLFGGATFLQGPGGDTWTWEAGAPPLSAALQVQTVAVVSFRAAARILNIEVGCAGISSARQSHLVATIPSKAPGDPGGLTGQRRERNQIDIG